jgi:hypothetical protein
MPFMKNGKRDYEREKQWDHSHDGGQRLKDRVKRVLARRAVEKKTGDLPPSKHVDHKRALTSGGSNSIKNLRVVSAKTNLRKEAQRKRNAR